MKKAAEMTERELTAAARNYDNVMNEGGDGFNPYASELDSRAAKSQAKAAAEHAATPQGRIDALYRRVERECGSVAREWGNTEEIVALQSSLYAEIEKIEAEINGKFLAEWTPEITTTRRQTWNDFVKSFGPGKMTPADMAAIHNKQKDQGWKLDDLRKAVKLNNL